MTQQKIFNSSAALGLAAQLTEWLKFSKASVRADCISARNGLSQEAPLGRLGLGYGTVTEYVSVASGFMPNRLLRLNGANKPKKTLFEYEKSPKVPKNNIT